jgi:small subunit ribosomal protein S6
MIVNPTVEEEKLKELVKKFTDLINTNGKVEKVDELGKKKLAYEIKKFDEGFYFVFYFDAEPTLIAELERNYRITDEVIKYLDIKKDVK